jgi:large subunit ribosomal protein L1
MAEAKKIVKKTKKAAAVAKTVTKPSKKKSTEVEVQPVITEVPAAEAEIASVAKAGKRSTKSQRQVAEEKAKEERKAQVNEQETDNKPKPAVKPTRSRLERRGKKYRAVAQKVEVGQLYSADQALELATQTSPTTFDATVELHINLNVDPKQADQNIRDNILLPAGTGKSVRVAAFTDDKVEQADLVGIDAITKDLEKGVMNFDILVATPATMSKLGKYARQLGPRGLMPNPKSGTVTNDVNKAVAEAKAGRVEYRVDSTGIVHLGIGKVSFGKDKLSENFQAVIASIKNNKPASVKANYIKSIYITTSMGPSIAVAINDL